MLHEDDDRFGTTDGHEIVPRTGSVLLFEHQCYHEGATLEQGRKYVVRSDLMYTDKGPGHEYSKGLNRSSERIHPANGKRRPDQLNSFESTP